MSQAINAAFSPPAVLSNDYGAYLVSCTAVPPASFSINIAGSKYLVSGQDLIVPIGNDVCLSGVSDVDGIAYAVLGDVFLKK